MVYSKLYTLMKLTLIAVTVDAASWLADRLVANV